MIQVLMALVAGGGASSVQVLILHSICYTASCVIQ